jgi:hypothetical protein
VRDVDGWPADFWDLWCRGTIGVVVAGGGIGRVAEVVVEVGEGFGCMAEVVVEVGEGFGHMVEVVVEDWCWVAAIFGRAEVPASALAGEGC